MIRISGTNDARKTAPAKKAGGASATFRPGGASGGQSSAAPQIDKAAQTAMMSALISLQSDGGGNAKTLAAAQRTLDLLDSLQKSVLEGDFGKADLAALGAAARLRAHAAADPQLQNIYDEIALRARVELAKLGR